MNHYKEMVCIRCGHPLGSGNLYEGCPVCKAQGVGANYTTVYDLNGASLPEAGGQPGIFRWRDFYPLAEDAVPVSIGEGNTPLLHLSRLGEEIGLPNLYVKDETRNPTLSYKDRICSLLVSMARYDGAPAVTISSTGNHGAAAAAYAAAAGLPCIVFTVPQVPQTMKTLMQVYGACVIVTPTAKDRWTIMKQCVEQLGWAPLSGYQSPAIGTSACGIDAYKSISFEIYEQMGGKMPKAISVPACYSDGLYGTYKGACDLKAMGYIEELPQFVAAEVFGSLQTTVESGEKDPVVVPSDWSVSFSIANGQCTWQGLQAVRGSNGWARSSSDSETLKMQRLLASKEGIYAEASSVTSLVALQKLAAEKKLNPDDKVVAVLTSTGLKDPETTAKELAPVPQIAPEMSELRAVLRDTYGLRI
ncbi:MAG: pyridoxal-phosphate dependent enzyme [Clostridiales bacterium]|nr:pyridoxal-phosphate dependent enzyme [Clostridiales bacterium]